MKAVLLILACSALGGWIHSGLEGYLAQPPPPFYVKYQSRQCAVRVVRHLHYPNHMLNLFPAPLQDSLRSLSMSRSIAKHYYDECMLPCVDPDTCVNEMSVPNFLAYVLIRTGTEDKLLSAIQYLGLRRENPIRHEFSRLEDFLGSHRRQMLDKYSELRYPEHENINTNDHAGMQQPCRCTVRQAASDAIYQIATHRYHIPPATINDAVAQNWCPCDISIALEPYNYILATSISDIFVNLLNPSTWTFNATILAFRADRLPPRRIHNIWLEDTAWRVFPPQWSSPRSMVPFVWDFMAASLHQWFLNELREWGRDGVKDEADLRAARAKLTDEEREDVIKDGWLIAEDFQY